MAQGAIDSTTSKLHKAAHGSQKKQTIGVSRGGCGTKIHAFVDAFGHAVGLALSPANGADIAYAWAAIGPWRPSKMLADKGYDSNPFRRRLRAKKSGP